MNFTEWVVLSGIFVSVLMLVALLVNIGLRHIRSDKRAKSHTSKDDSVAELLAINDYFSIDREQYAHYFNLSQKARTDDLGMRLLRCGFLSIKAKLYLQIIRTALMLVAALSLFIGLQVSGSDLGLVVQLSLAAMAAALMYLLVGFALDKLEQQAMRNSRKLLPDLLDLLIVCLDAGISLDAAFERVSREFAVTNANFSFHLVILSLEVRAGRSLSKAMVNLAQRLRVEEFNALAILFQQSERLGASVNDTLRIFSEEMREKRLLLAEEKANALPVKMLFPMAVLIFPVNLFIVLVPVMMNLMVMFADF